MRIRINPIMLIIICMIIVFAVALPAFAVSPPTYVKGLVVGSQGLKGPGAKFYTSARLTATANTTQYTGVFAVSRAMTITGARVAFQAAPASTSGTVTIALTNYDLSATTDDNLLSAATFDLETLTAKNSTALTLSATATDLVLAAGDYVYVTIISNNADMTGALGGVLTLEYILN